MRFEVHPYQAGRWTDPETPAEARRGSAVFSQAGRRRGEAARSAGFWKSTLELLDAETRALEVDGVVVIEAGFADWDMRIDRSGPLAKAVSSHPGVVVSFTSRLWGPMRFATDVHDAAYSGDPPGWQANVRAVALTLGALRAIDRWGVARRGQQYTGWRALPAAGGLTFPSADAALRWMQEHKPKGFMGDTARELYRALARRMHPEGQHEPGWEADDWTRLENAKLLLTAARMMLTSRDRPGGPLAGKLMHVHAAPHLLTHEDLALIAMIRGQLADGGPDRPSTARRRRDALGVKVGELAGVLGLSTAYVSMIERGVRRPSAEYALAYARELDALEAAARRPAA